MHQVVALTSEAITSFDLTGIMQNAVTQVQGDLFGVLVIVVPAIAVVTAAVVGVKFGHKWLKSLGK